MPPNRPSISASPTQVQNRSYAPDSVYFSPLLVCYDCMVLQKSNIIHFNTFVNRIYSNKWHVILLSLEEREGLILLAHLYHISLGITYNKIYATVVLIQNQKNVEYIDC